VLEHKMVQMAYRILKRIRHYKTWWERKRHYKIWWRYQPVCM